MKYLFIVNPISGHPCNPKPHENAIRKIFKNQHFEILHTQHRGHARELAQQRSNNSTAIIAVGGDGTVNEIASGILGAQDRSTLGIIPKGSGNGLAFEFGMSKNPIKACQQLLEGKIIDIDAGQCNDRYFFNIAGIGLDAETAWAFDQHHWRGRWPYYYLTAKTLLTLKMPSIELATDQQKFNIKPLIIAVANGKQFGDGAEIAPKSRIDDGLFHLTIVLSNVSLWKFLMAAPRLFNGTLDQDQAVETLTSKKVSIKMPQTLAYHLDGEPFKDAAQLELQVIKKALRVLLPQGYKP